MKKIYTKIIQKTSNLISKNYFPYLIILAFSFLLMYPVFFGKIYFGADNEFHIYSFLCYAKDLPFSIFAKILPDMVNNLGFGVGIFYPPFPHILGAFIYKIGSLVGVGGVATLTIMNMLAYLGAGITMYLLAQKIFKGNKMKSLIASLFYITYNYFFVDVVIRGALNESYLFMFMPLIFLGLYYLFYEQNYKMFYIWFILGYVGLMYTHLVMSVYFTLFLIVFLLFYIKEIFNKKTFLSLLFAGIFILIFTSTFTVPMIEHKLFGDYVAFIDRTWTIKDVWVMPFQGFFIEYLYSDGYGGFIYSNMNFILVILFIFGLYRIIVKKTDDTRRKFLLALAIFSFLGILGNSFTSMWLHVPKILLSIQFIWRLCTFVIIGFALVAAYGFESYLDMFKKKYVYVGFIIIIVFLAYFSVSNYDRLKYDKHLVLRDPVTYMGVREHFPMTTYKNHMDYVVSRDNKKIIVLNGSADVKLISNDVPNMKFQVKNISKKTTIELPRLYYLGYKITDKKGNVIKYKQDKFGFISLQIDKNGIYEVKYTGTLAYKVATVIKYTMIIIVACYCIYRYRKQIKIRR